MDAVAPHPQALAHYTDRNIISVPLSQIATNQQLQDIVFDQSFKVACPANHAAALQPPCSILHGALMRRHSDVTAVRKNHSVRVALR